MNIWKITDKIFDSKLGTVWIQIFRFIIHHTNLNESQQALFFSGIHNFLAACSTFKYSLNKNSDWQFHICSHTTCEREWECMHVLLRQTHLYLITPNFSSAKIKKMSSARNFQNGDILICLFAECSVWQTFWVLIRYCLIMRQCRISSGSKLFAKIVTTRVQHGKGQMVYLQ